VDAVTPLPRVIRVCTVATCGVRLSKWNTKDTCWEHTAGAGVIEGSSHRIVATSKPPHSPTRTGTGTSSDRFRFGVPEGLTARETTSYWTGEW
jgi:hypothetical protein